MQLPNKLYSYNKSILSKLPSFLRIVKEAPIGVLVLYDKVKVSLEDATDFLTIMDCLYALNKIDINESGEIYYVG